VKKLGIVLLLLASTSAFAFGGGGGGRTRRFYERHGGVDAIGVHIHDGGKQADINVCADDEELVGDECLKKCGEGLERNTDNTCTVCTNGNVYLSYNTDPCGTASPMQTCTNGSDCWFGLGDDACCDTITHTCKVASPIYSHAQTIASCPTTNDKQCTSNKNCANGEYCHIMNSMFASCEAPDIGTCLPIGEYADTSVAGLGAIRRSNTAMTWWAAENWCKAQEKSLLDISKFECYKSDTTTRIENKDDFAGGCCASGQSCSFDSFWYIDTKRSQYSNILQALESTFGHDSAFWTLSSHGRTDDCFMYVIYLTGGDTANDPLPYDAWLTFGGHANYALCQ